MLIGQLKINKGFFYGAGSPKMFDWKKDGYHIFGVGIDVGLLNQYNILEVEVGGSIYKLDTDLARQFLEHYDSYQTIKGTRVGVISKSLLDGSLPHIPQKTVEIPPSSSPKPKEVVDNKQGQLFETPPRIHDWR